MRTTLMEAIKHNVNSIVIPAFGGACGGLNYDLIAKLMYRGFCQVFGEQPAETTWENHLSNRALYLDVNVNNEEHHFMKSPYFNVVVGNIVDDSILSNPKLAVLYAKRIIKDGAGKTPTEIAPGTKVYQLVEELAKYLPETIQIFKVQRCLKSNLER